ncbi:SDR family oxidoreductase [soil metagenome]
MGLLDGKVGVVAGVGPGLGRSMALAFAREGAAVVLVARREETTAQVAAEITNLGVRAVTVAADVTDPDACARVVEQAADRLGRIDVLVNNAFHQGDRKRLVDADLDDWRATMEVNLFGALALTRAAVPHLAERGDGRVIMVNTMSVQRIEAKFGAYAASKGALATVTKTLAAELGPQGIRVNGIHPGYIWADSVEWWFNNQAEKRGVSFETVYGEVAGQTALGYLAPADEVAGTVVFLASDLARPITGQSIGVNAGHWFS